MSVVPRTVMAGAEPFSAEGGPVGVVLSHGFTGTPQSLRPWGEHLAAAGLSVRIPLLPGHGTRWQDLNTTTWEQWYDAVERAFDELAGRCEQVFAMGLSMGGTLVLRLAQQRGPAVAGLVLVNPSVLTTRFDANYLLPLLRWLVSSFPGVANDIKKPGATELAYDRTPLRATYSLSRLWRLVRADMGKVSQPVLLMTSRDDHVVEPQNAEAILAGVSSTQVQHVVLDDSYHVATLDNDAPRIFAESLDFVRAHTVSRSGG